MGNSLAHFWYWLDDVRDSSALELRLYCQFVSTELWRSCLHGPHWLVFSPLYLHARLCLPLSLLQCQSVYLFVCLAVCKSSLISIRPLQQTSVCLSFLLYRCSGLVCPHTDKMPCSVMWWMNRTSQLLLVCAVWCAIFLVEANRKVVWSDGGECWDGVGMAPVSHMVNPSALLLPRHREIVSVLNTAFATELGLKHLLVFLNTVATVQ